MSCQHQRLTKPPLPQLPELCPLPWGQRQNSWNVSRVNPFLGNKTKPHKTKQGLLLWYLVPLPAQEHWEDKLVALSSLSAPTLFASSWILSVHAGLKLVCILISGVVWAAYFVLQESWILVILATVLTGKNRIIDCGKKPQKDCHLESCLSPFDFLSKISLKTL